MKHSLPAGLCFENSTRVWCITVAMNFTSVPLHVRACGRKGENLVFHMKT